MTVMKTLVKKAALLIIALALTVSAPGCVADREAQADRRKPAKADTAYYQHEAGNSYSQIEWAPVGKPPNWKEP
jgi:hypothetical protein